MDLYEFYSGLPRKTEVNQGDSVRPCLKKKKVVFIYMDSKLPTSMIGCPHSAKSSFLYKLY